MSDNDCIAFVVEGESKEPDIKVFILSAFPEFLLNYFPISFWRTCIKRKELDISCRVP